MEDIKYNFLKYQDEFKYLVEQWKAKGDTQKFFDKDPALWKTEPEHKKIIENRLGWLNAPEEFKSRIQEITGFVKEIKAGGFKDIVLLGMGGSILCSEVLRKTYPHKKSFPRLYVLDSTDPETILNIEKSVDLRHTLFVVASKSGTTIEALSYFKYFYKKISFITRCGFKNFCAITDQGTPLEKDAQRIGFCKIFINPSDIGGRYSALSFFGLVPAALAGIDIKKMLDDATNLLEKSKKEPLYTPFGLGICIGLFATKGKNKITIITDPKIKHFGLWLEQLIAESTGKEGKGVLPITDEPVMKTYSDDRLFVYLKCGKSCIRTKDLIKNLVQQKKPVIEIQTKDIKNIGSDIMGWEIATAVCASVMNINPFDEPNVQESKENTKMLLENPKQMKALHKPLLKLDEAQIKEFLKDLKPPEYVAILFYGEPQRYAFKNYVQKIRQAISKSYAVATIVGIGPRYLHSTGQIFKGGPKDSRFIFITTKSKTDCKIPSSSYTFKKLQSAQAIGDIQAILNRKRKCIWIEISEEDELKNFLSLIKNRVR